MKRFDEVAKAFACRGRYLGEEEYGSGHINDTFKAYYETNGGVAHYIRQRINHFVFSDVPALMRNIGTVTRHHRLKLDALGVANLEHEALTLVPTLDGEDYFQDREGNYWRTYIFVEDAVGFDIVQNRTQAFEAARAFGEFQKHLADLPARLSETIPDFHHTRKRYDAVVRAVEKDAFNRAALVQDELEFVSRNEDMVDVVVDLMSSGEIPERVTHNDTKLNNVLINSATGKARCVIDLDTVMPGSVLYDFGDLVRTTTSTTAEDERNLARVGIDMTYFEAIVEGYLGVASSFLAPKEIELLPFAGALITFETGLRFLADYLQGDVYFKTSRDGQNLDRCRKQFAMVRSMQKRMDEMRCVVEGVLCAS